MKIRLNEMRKINLLEIQQIQLNIVKDVDRICKKYNIKYYLISGSCLGAIRHKGFIPWDDDIDIAMMREDYDFFLSLFDKEFNTNLYYLQNEKSEHEFVWPLSRIVVKNTFLDIPSKAHIKINQGMFLDIFPLDNIPDSNKLRKKQEKWIKTITKLINRKVYRKSELSYKNYVKYIISILLSPIPLSFLKKTRYNFIVKYNKYSTSCVGNMASQYGYQKQIMPREVYGNPKLMFFNDLLLPFPERPEEYLSRLFGENYMQIPPLHKRRVPTPVYLLDNCMINQ